MHIKSIGPPIQKYIAKKKITDLNESYSNPKNDKNPIPIIVKIQKAIIRKNNINKIKEIIAKN